MPRNLNPDVPATAVGKMIQQEMDKKGWNVQNLTDEVGSTYEYVRKVVRGLTLPSKYMLHTIASKLDMKVEELERAMVEDSILHKHGKAALRFRGIEPRVAKHYDVLLQ